MPKEAIKDAEEHLLSSLYAQARYKAELSEIRKLINKAPSEQKNKMNDLLSPDEDKLGEEYYDAVNNAMKFMDFTLTEK